MSGCKGCFQEQRALDDTFKQTKVNAQILANDTGKEVAIIVKQYGYTYALVGEIDCNCTTREIVKPML